LRTAWEDARHHLTRDEFYWGALASALSARAAAVAGRGVAAVVAELHGDVSGLVEQYMTEVRNMSAAETEKSVSTTRQYWAVALTAPYWTLSENLDARTHLQVGVTGATLAHLLRQTATTAGREDDALLKAVRERAATVYYHETVQAATGPLPAFRDPLPGPTSPTAVAGVLPGFSQ